MTILEIIFTFISQIKSNHPQIKRAKNTEDNSPIQKIFDVCRISLKEIQIILNMKSSSNSLMLSARTTN